MLRNVILPILQRAAAVLRLDTTNPAAYKTIEDFQSDEVTTAGREKEGVRLGQDSARSASALVGRAGIAIGILQAETVFSGARQDQYDAWLLRAEQNGAASRLSRPDQIQPLAAP